MTKILLLILVMVCAAPFTQAQTYSGANQPDKRGALRVRVSDNGPISIEVDGKRFKKYGTSLFVGDLPKGRRYIRIFERDDNSRRHRQVLYEGVVRIHKHKLTDAILDMRTGYLDESLLEIPAQPPVAQNNNQYNNVRPIEGNGNYNNGNNNNGNNSQGSSQYNNSYQGSNNNNNDNNNQGNRSGYIGSQVPPRPIPPTKNYTPVPADYVVLTANDVSKTGQKVNEKITDTDKLKVLEAALKKKSFNTDQLGIMMGWLTFEQSKLELAKWAFSHTTDKGNFPNLEQKLSENNNRYELDSYINGQGK
jgi:hypothetical protein